MKEDKDPADRVTDWLTTVGYPLEFRALEAFRQCEFRTLQGHYVASPGTAPLDLDVLAWRENADRTVTFEVVAECKVVPSPEVWVAFREAQLPTASPTSGLLRTGAAQRAEDAPSNDEFSTAFRATEYWSEPPAFSVKAMKKNGQPDSAYDCLQQLARTVLGRLTEIEQPKRRSLLVPVVVIDGTLISATWDHATGRFAVKEVSDLQLRWKGAKEWPNRSMTVQVSTTKGLERLVRRMDRMGQAWLQLHEQAATGHPRSP